MRTELLLQHIRVVEKVEVRVAGTAETIKHQSFPLKKFSTKSRNSSSPCQTKSTIRQRTSMKHARGSQNTKSKAPNQERF